MAWCIARVFLLRRSRGACRCSLDMGAPLVFSGFAGRGGMLPRLGPADGRKEAGNRRRCVAWDMSERQRLADLHDRSEEHTSELQSLMRISYAVFCLKKKNHPLTHDPYT